MERLLHRFRSEHGTSLVEVIAAAVILVVISGAITSLVAGAQRDSGQSRVVSIAGDLAQSELEELRARKFADVVNIAESATNVERGGVRFNIDRTSAWVTGNGDPVDCDATTQEPDALRVSVKVTWNDMHRKPVQVDTLFAAPAGTQEGKGNFVVRVNNRDAVGVPGMNVTMNGPTTQNGITNDDGCVRFSGLQQGEYKVQFNRAGWVTPEHKNVIDDPVTVIAGETGSASYDYDQGGGIWVRFYQGLSATQQLIPPGATFKYQSLPVTAQFPDATDRSYAKEPFPLWPATSQYEVHADVCADGLPAGSHAVDRGVFPFLMVPSKPAALRVNVPRVRLQVRGIDAFGGASLTSIIKGKLVTRCGTTFDNIGPATSGAYSTANGGTWTSDWKYTPPGVLLNACIYGSMSGQTRWVSARKDRVRIDPIDPAAPSTQDVTVVLGDGLNGTVESTGVQSTIPSCPVPTT